MIWKPDEFEKLMIEAWHEYKNTGVKGQWLIDFEDLSGRRFGRLVAIEPHGLRAYTLWKCVCDCGSETSVIAYALKSGNTKSCGCIVRENLAAIRLARRRSIKERRENREKAKARALISRATGLRAKFIPDVFVEAKRAQLKIYRLLKESKS